MALRADEITQVLERELVDYDKKLQVEDVGTILKLGDNIATVYGLRQAMAGELLEFPGGVMGMVLNLEDSSVGVALLGSDVGIKEGDTVKRTGRIASVPVGEAMLGRVVNPLGQPLDGKGPIATDKFRVLERLAPNVVSRQPVKQPLMTGLKSIDAMIPIGRGQRELIIGDRQTGKTAIALDTIINQKGTGVICIYVAIGQRASTVVDVVEKLEKHGAMGHTIVVAATADDPASLLYIAPYAGVTMGEEFMEQGKHVLCVYDDLSKQAASYRQLALLLRRPPGREAYPGDVFYLHSRLLERAAKLEERYIVVKKGAPADTAEGVDGKKYRFTEEGPHQADEARKKLSNPDDHEVRMDPTSGGSLTALPIIETQAGDISAYIPTNVISITDGQIFLEPDLFYAGIRPAVNVGLSVSRVGGNAQTKAMRKVGGQLRLDMAQYRELAAFAQFGSDLDASTQAQLTRGERLVEVLKQDQFIPQSLANQVMILFAASKGYLDDIPALEVRDFEAGLLKFVPEKYPDVMHDIEKIKDLPDELQAKMRKAIEDFKAEFKKGGK
ncbi:F0F1 ATP synthase subunit alpha [Candidatus Sumerlaeota bacterium]|nr:F0F1 ATP synthase subunit alpha [Candidatus Sumerlaeota bacterium]